MNNTTKDAFIALSTLISKFHENYKFKDKEIEELEAIICKDGLCSYRYSVLLNKRFEAGEKAIGEDSWLIFCYYRHFGSLPSLLHNKMLAVKIANPDDCFANAYFENLELKKKEV